MFASKDDVLSAVIKIRDEFANLKEYDLVSKLTVVADLLTDFDDQVFSLPFNEACARYKQLLKRVEFNTAVASLDSDILLDLMKIRSKVDSLYNKKTYDLETLAKIKVLAILIDKGI